MAAWETGLTTTTRRPLSEPSSPSMTPSELDRRLDAEPTPAERAVMLGRIDEIEYEIDAVVRGGIVDKLGEPGIINRRSYA